MLLDEIKRLKDEIAAIDKEDQEEEVKVEEAEEEVEEQPEEEAKEESKPEEKVEAKEEKKEEELDNTGYARLRREAAAEKRRAEQLEREIADLRKAREAEQEIEQPEAIQLPPELQSVIQEHQITRAEREFSMFEDKVKRQFPEYGAVASEYAQAMYQSIKLQNLGKSDIELNEMTKKAILMKASEFARAGYENPVEEMYHMAKEFGFTGKSFQREEPKPEPKEEIKPDLRKVAENRKRSTGMTANNGRAEGLMTLTHAATELSASEWAKLPAAEKRRLMYGS